MTDREEAQPVHGSSEAFNRFVRCVEIDFALDAWLQAFIQGGKEAAGPYPFDLWRERYFPESEEAGPYIILTPRNNNRSFTLGAISAAWEGDIPDDEPKYRFADWKWTLDGRASGDPGSTRAEVEDGLRACGVPVVSGEEEDRPRVGDAGHERVPDLRPVEPAQADGGQDPRDPDDEGS